MPDIGDLNLVDLVNGIGQIEVEADDTRAPASDDVDYSITDEWTLSDDDDEPYPYLPHDLVGRADSPTIPTVPFTAIEPRPRPPSPPRTTDFRPIPVNHRTLGRRHSLPDLTTRESLFDPLFLTGVTPGNVRSATPTPNSSSLVRSPGPTLVLSVERDPVTGELIRNPETGYILLFARPISASEAARRLRNLPPIPPYREVEESRSRQAILAAENSTAAVTSTTPSPAASSTSASPTAAATTTTPSVPSGSPSTQTY